MDINFFTGLMGSGKSKKMIEMIDYFGQKDNLPLAVSFEKKAGERTFIESRNGDSIEGFCLSENGEGNISFLDTLLERTSINNIYIDEIQFLSRKALKELLNYLKNKDVNLFLYGLETTFTGSYFESSEYLINNLKKSQIHFIVMNCQTDDCYSKADYNGRIVDGKVAREGAIFVSEKSKYLALCEKCYFS